MADAKHPGSSNLLESTLARIRHLDITDRLSYDKNAHPFAGGSYGDIRIGAYNHPDRGKLKVAVKCIRVFHAQNPGITKLIKREVQVWSSLDHANILPLLGYILEEKNFPTLVSEFMENGTALQYVLQHPELDVIGIILGIAEGVSYLHGRNIVHSDLKSDNVLISQQGTPLVCDFGISHVIALSGSLSGYNMQSSSGTGRGSARWMAPELFSPPTNRSAVHTRESDIWAFAMTASELLAKRRPYHKLKADLQVVFAIVKGERPERPEDSVWPRNYRRAWQLCETCWSVDPDSRPLSSKIISLLSTIDSIGATIDEVSEPTANPGTMIEQNEDTDPESITYNPINSKDNSIPAVTVNTEDKQEERLRDLEESVDDCRNQLAQFPPKDPFRPESLRRLAEALRDRYREAGRIEDSWESIRLYREALGLFPMGSTDRIVLLEDIALCFCARFERNGETKDIQQIATHYRMALSLCSEDHPDRDYLLGEAGYWFEELYMNTGRTREIEEAISINRACLALRPRGHPRRDTALINLAFGLSERFKVGKRDEDIDEAIMLEREALSLRSESHNNRSQLLNTLGYKLYLRYGHRGNPLDIEESIERLRAALALCPEDHHQHYTAISRNLANALDARFKRFGDMKDGEKATMPHPVVNGLGKQHDVMNNTADS